MILFIANSLFFAFFWFFRYHNDDIFFRMFKKILSTFLLFFSVIWFFSVDVFAAELSCNGSKTDDIRCPEYQIFLWNMDPVGVDHPGLSSSGWKWALLFVLQNFSEFLLFMIPIIAAVSLLIAGYFYIFSAWDSEKTSKAKTIIKWNIIAMLVAFFSYWLIQIIVQLFSF